jgi:hypothetical protein
VRRLEQRPVRAQLERSQPLLDGFILGHDQGSNLPAVQDVVRHWPHDGLLDRVHPLLHLFRRLGRQLSVEQLRVLDEALLVADVQDLPTVFLGALDVRAAACGNTRTTSTKNATADDANTLLLMTTYPGSLIMPRGSWSCMLRYHMSFESTSTNQRFFQFLEWERAECVRVCQEIGNRMAGIKQWRL